MLLTPSTELRSSYNASADFLLNPNLCQQEQKWAPNLGTLFFPRGESPRNGMYIRIIPYLRTVSVRLPAGRLPAGRLPASPLSRWATISLFRPSAPLFKRRLVSLLSRALGESLSFAPVPSFDGVTWWRGAAIATLAN